jgi:glutamine amidotransferase
VIAIVDYGLGNLGSVANMLRKIGVPAKVTSTADEIRSARGLILPGVGHFDEGMRKLRERCLGDVLTDRVIEAKTPVLGICLGMQLLTRRSEEGSEPGLGWIGADVKRFVFSAGARLSVPHMGWNEIDIVDEDMFRAMPSTPPRFYFVHSFHVVCDESRTVAAWSTYGTRFPAAIHAGNIYGAQFHPEKSHRFGMAVLKNFAAIVGNAT